ncbi:unnamed protein product [Peronospora destructor]|uniref:SET domain-containing protein n=1 Tax=Peronospora destructor TaxID=86335 RepID=A0AAV0UR15_9STRA|nr:unnamed protein product [Peronospora destructor]
MRRRYRDCYDQQALNYVLSLREHVAKQSHSTLGFDVVRINVDATCSGNLTRFVNHSCSPNLDVKAIRVDSFKCNGMKKSRQSEKVDYVNCRSLKCRGYLPFVLE